MQTTLSDEITLDDAQETFRHHRTKATAGQYLHTLLQYEIDDMVGDDTFFNGLSEIGAWLSGSNPRR